jgi:hypothetical protein
MVTAIVKSLHNGCDQISSVLTDAVSRQSVFVGREKCQYLLDAPVEKIRLMKKKLMRGPHQIQSQRQQEKALEVLDRIEKEKARLQRKLEAAAALKVMVRTIPADQLLEAMFWRVYHAMYRPHWPLTEQALETGRPDADVDITTYQATIEYQ